MRIVGGTLSGRKLEPPLSLTTRPMMDRVRESLFNIIAHRDWGRQIGNVFANCQVLDAFCGTGALAFEALSRGAKFATLFDKDSDALRIATQNARALGLAKQCQIMLADALSPPPATAPCKLVFLAPPYKMDLILPALAAADEAGWISEHALIVAETQKKEKLETPEGYRLEISRTYGIATLHFFTR